MRPGSPALGRPKTFILGVTGIAGSGKSTLCRYLKEQYGFHWIEADSIVRDIYQKNARGYELIRDYFGEYYVGSHRVHRGRLRRLVLQNQQKLWILNKVIHPLILHELNKKIAQVKMKAHKNSSPCICVEIFYIEKSDFKKRYDEILLVETSDANALARLKPRAIPLSQKKQLIKLQQKIVPRWPPHCIRNSGAIEEFYRAIDVLCATIKAPCTSLSSD